MKLVAMMPVCNEMDRYLPQCIESLLEFCDEIRVLDDGSADGTYEWLRNCTPSTKVQRNDGPSWAEHEGRFRQRLLDWTREADPTHILAIDADEFVVDGPGLRTIISRNPREVAFALKMCEVWSTDPWLTREDGGWHAHDVGICFTCPRRWRRDWQISNKQMAGGRVPVAVQKHRRPVRTGIDILHLGWARPKERRRRYKRYATLDGGKFHANRHIESIMWPDERCDLRPYRTPIAL